ncbi:Chitin synthase, class 2 [Nowakowskiella sp. JEL0407]|nr:Chitin synthase, class 2 [Nowakowskiella sp. JEL0407]
MTSVAKNIAHFCSKKCPRTWGPNGWQKIVVCIVSDGRTKIHPKVLNILGLMGIWMEDLIKTSITEAIQTPNGGIELSSKPVTAHVLEFTTQVNVDPDMKVQGFEDGLVPMQVLFCLKEKNAKKINSHRWFFNAFAPIIKPNVCVLLDVGTKPTDRSIYHLWRAFDRNKNVGGACGEICADTGMCGYNLFNPIVASQNFEYKMSNVMDKPLESVFGYISVLPGAFSAYRYAALQNSTLNSGPLSSYFKGETLHNGEADVFSANMYLAEDRILCFELVTKKGEKWVLKYVKSAKAETDVPSTLAELISQRRRWLNGSFFAAVHAITHFAHFVRSSHGWFQIALFMVLTIYNTFNLVFSWFSIGNFYLTFFYLFNGINNPDYDPFDGSGKDIFRIFNSIYIASLVVVFVSSFGNRPHGSKLIYLLIVIIFGIIMLVMMFLGGYAVYQEFPKTAKQWEKFESLIKQPAFRDVVISLGTTWGMYAISSILHLEPWHIITSTLQYIIFLPTYVNVFMVYSFCNLHDISWGTKGDNVHESPKTISNNPTTQTITLKRNSSTLKQISPSPDLSFETTLPNDDSVVRDKMYAMFAEGLRSSAKETKKSRDQKTKIDDYFKLYRTHVVLLWMASNGLLVTLLTTEPIYTMMMISQTTANGTTKSINPYLTFIFWTVAALSSIRFIGSTVYLFTWIYERSTDRFVAGTSANSESSTISNESPARISNNANDAQIRYQQRYNDFNRKP